MFGADGSPGWLFFKNRLRDQESFHHKYHPSSRDMESYVSSVGGREREKGTGRQADRKQTFLKWVQNKSVKTFAHTLCRNTIDQ